MDTIQHRRQYRRCRKYTHEPASDSEDYETFPQNLSSPCRTYCTRLRLRFPSSSSSSLFLSRSTILALRCVRISNRISTSMRSCMDCCISASSLLNASLIVFLSFWFILFCRSPQIFLHHSRPRRVTRPLLLRRADRRGNSS